MGDLMKPDAFWFDIGDRIQAQRKRQKMSQQALADNIGVTRASITNIEAGRQRVELSSLYDIAEWLDCEVAEFLPARRP